MTKIACFFRGATALAVGVVAALIVAAPARSQDALSKDAPAKDAPARTECGAPAELTRLDHPLNRLSRRIAGGHPIKIVAIGSSSTAGAGASSPAMSYPSRLQVELQALLPRVPVTVVNRGANGEEARDMVARFERDVFSEKPDLVIWQVGSNSVLRDRPLSQSGAPLRDGLKLLHGQNVDVVLINPQYAPKVIVKHDVEGMVHLIAVAAKETGVDLFQRFAVMRYWRLTEDIPFSAFTSADELHMNDWSYGCIAMLLAGSIHDAATRPTLTATVGGRH